MNSYVKKERRLILPITNLDRAFVVQLHTLSEQDEWTTLNMMSSADDNAATDSAKHFFGLVEHNGLDTV